MTYYIIDPAGKTNHNDYKIIKVPLADEANFLEDYGHQVLTSGNSLMEALLAFEQWKNNQQEEQ